MSTELRKSSHISEMQCIESDTCSAHTGLNWYRANISLKHLALTEAPQLPKLNVPILGIWSSHDYFLTEEQMKASEQ